MVQVNPENDEQDPSGDEASAVSRREHAKALEKIRELELKDLARGAGLDPKSGVGELFIGSYKGDMTEEAVSAFIAEKNLLPPTPPASEQPPAGEIKDGSHIPAEERSGTDDRQMAAAGVIADSGPPSGDPRQEAIRKAEEHIAAGGNTESGMALAFDEIAEAGFNGDQRARWWPGKEDDKRPNLGW